MGAVVMICWQIALWSFCIYGIVKLYKTYKANEAAAKKKHEDELLKRGEEVVRKEVQRREWERKEQEQKRLEELWRENHPDIMAEFQHFKELMVAASIERPVRFFCIGRYEVGDDNTGVSWWNISSGETLKHVVEVFAERELALIVNCLTYGAYTVDEAVSVASGHLEYHYANCRHTRELIALIDKARKLA